MRNTNRQTNKQIGSGELARGALDSSTVANDRKDGFQQVYFTLYTDSERQRELAARPMQHYRNQIKSDKTKQNKSKPQIKPNHTKHTVNPVCKLCTPYHSFHSFMLIHFNADKVISITVFSCNEVGFLVS